MGEASACFHSQHYLTVEAILKKNGIISDSLDELSTAELEDLLLHKNFKLSPKDFDEGIVESASLNGIMGVIPIEIIRKMNTKIINFIGKISHA